MKEITLYCCEVCGTQYKDRNKAAECEKSHRRPVKIVAKKYHPIEMRQGDYPFSVEVLFDDGKKIIYKR